MIHWWKGFWDGTSEKLTWWQQIVTFPILIVGNLLLGLVMLAGALGFIATWIWVAYCCVHLLRGS